MEKKLEKMRKDIQGQLGRKSALLGCIIVLIGVVTAGVFPVQSANQDIADYLQGFQLGGLMAVAVITLSQVVRYQKALKDNTNLKQLYYKEHDERLCYIRQKVGKSSMEITPILMIIVAVIAGYFDFKVFVTLVGATVFLSLINIGFKIYYSHTMSGEEE